MRKLRQLFKWLYPADRYFRGTQTRGGAELLNTDWAFTEPYYATGTMGETFSISIQDAFMTGRIGWFHSYATRK